MSEEKPGCLSLFFPRRFKSRNQSKQSISDAVADYYPYRISDRFLSPSEHSFFLVTQKVLGSEFFVAPKVPLSEIFFITDHQDYNTYWNRINRKRVDFLVCDAVSMKPRFAIELDDSSHNRQSRIERDDFVNNVFKAAGMPLVRVSAKNTYSTSELTTIFADALKLSTHQTIDLTKNQSSEQPAEANAEEANPICPKCGAPMVLRIAKTGTRAGTKFYGCTNYPNCRTVIPIKEI